MLWIKDILLALFRNTSLMSDAIINCKTSKHHFGVDRFDSKNLKTFARVLIGFNIFMCKTIRLTIESIQQYSRQNNYEQNATLQH